MKAATSWRTFSIPGLPADDILSAVHRFYDEYYFRPKAVFRILKKAAFDSNDRKRLYKEAKTFLKLRSQRNKMVKQHSDEAAAELAKANDTNAFTTEAQRHGENP